MTISSLGNSTGKSYIREGSRGRGFETFPTKAMAERWLPLTEADMVRGEWAAPERRAETVGEWAERWLAQGPWRPQTKRSYAETWVAAVAPR